MESGTPNPKTCHQCRQKTMGLSALCKNLKVSKQCTLKYCHKCLLNRYGEKAEEVTLLADWKCPKCRDICNCSCCMKRKGHKPTGILVHTAKATGYTSVSDLLQAKGPENFGYEGVSSKKQKKEHMATSPRKFGKENSFDGDCDPIANSQNLTLLPNEKSEKMRREGLKELCNENGEPEASLKETFPEKRDTLEEVLNKKVKENEEDFGCISDKKNSRTEVQVDVPSSPSKGEETNCAESKKSGDFVEETNKEENGLNGFENGTTSVKVKPAVRPLPPGTSLITVAGIDLPPKDVGHALQFLEFCAAFGEVLDMKKGEPESVIREIMRGRGKCRLQYSPVVHIHTQLLSIIQKDTGKRFPSFKPSDNGYWVRALGECVSQSQCALEEVPSSFYDDGVDAYNALDSSVKLKLLNFLCDEALCTTTLRSWIDEENLKFADREKDAKEKVLVARDKEKQLKQKMQDEVAKAITEKSDSPPLVSEHGTIITQIRREAAQAHADVLQAVATLPKKKQRSDAVRTAPIVLDVRGHAFWRLRGYTSENHILLQDIGTSDPVASDEKWFVYDIEQKRDVEKYISSIRNKRLRIRKVSESLPISSTSSETNSLDA